MRRIFTGFALAVALAGPALADDVERVLAEGSVTQVMNALEAAVTGAGATVFARVDHSGGAASVGMDLKPMELLIFGNPQLGTPALQDNPLAGLWLPLRVLVYEDTEGLVWLAYQEVEEMFEEIGMDDDAAYVEKMEDALEALTRKASKG